MTTLVCLAANNGLAEEAHQHETHDAHAHDAHDAQPSEGELPEISAFIDIQALRTDADDNPNNEKLRIREVEVGIGGNLNPSVRADLIIALEQEYASDDSVESAVHVEEAYVSFLELPGGFEAQVGRTLIGFGTLNAIHPHHWAFADTPLALENLFGDHPWFDDGATISGLVPNPMDIIIGLSVGGRNGNEIDHGHAHEDEHEEDGHEEGDHDDDEDHEESDVIEWEGKLFTGRAFTDLPLTDRLNLQAGYSVILDEGNNLLQGTDIIFEYFWPQSHRRVTWHTERFAFDADDGESDPSGLFSAVQVTADEHWEFGGRYDRTELLADDTQDAWAGTGFVTYYLTHTTYVRGQYQFKEHGDGEEENIVTAQLVWGIGPHAH